MHGQILPPGFLLCLAKRVREIIGIIVWFVEMIYLGATLVRYRETATPIASAIAVCA